MNTFPRSSTHGRKIAAAGTTLALALALAACGSSGSQAHDHSSMPGMEHGSTSTASSATGRASSTGGMPGMDHPAPGNGLAESLSGYRLTSKDTTLPAGSRAVYRFTVTGPDRRPVTHFAIDQTKRMHFYAVRSDLTGFQHVHPAMVADGTWSADLSALAPGAWRVYATFIPDAGPGKGTDFVLSRTVTVPGTATKTPLPAPAATTRVDGYTVTFTGDLMAGMAAPLAVSVARDGRPVTDLHPYLDSYAHLTAFHERDGAFAHLHPTTEVTGDSGGPDLTFHADLRTAGNWRLFLQFTTGTTLHTAAVTLHVA